MVYEEWYEETDKLGEEHGCDSECQSCHCDD